MHKKIDHKKIVDERIATQYKESAKLVSYIKALVAEANTLEDVFEDILFQRTIDDATGSLLDIIGEIVGQKRIPIDTTGFEYFGFIGAVGAQSYGDLGNLSIGGRYVSSYEAIDGINLVADPEYRILIRAKIASNNSKGTINEIISLTSQILDVDYVELEEIQPARIRLGFGRPLTFNEKKLVEDYNIVPRPDGVALDTYEFIAGEAFGFFGVANVKGYDEGTYASL